MEECSPDSQEDPSQNQSCPIMADVTAPHHDCSLIRFVTRDTRTKIMKRGVSEYASISFLRSYAKCTLGLYGGIAVTRRPAASHPSLTSHQSDGCRRWGLGNHVHPFRYGFNCGSTGEISTEASQRAAARAVLNTTLGGGE